MAYYRRNRWNHQTAFSAAHNAVAAASTAALPQFPPADLVAKRIALVPHHTPFDPKTAPADLEALVLAVPFGKRNSQEIRQWAKKIGARWQMSTKQWLISKSRLTPDAVKIINELRLWAGGYERVSVAFVPRIYAPLARIILKVPYENRADAKAAGALWEKAWKHWYIQIPQNADRQFSEKIANLEVKGWVDADATDTWNVAYIHAAIPALVGKTEDLKAMRPKTEAEARSQVFADVKAVGSQMVAGATPAPNAPKGEPLLPEEVGFLNLILAYYNNGRGANTITQYTFGKDNATGGWRMDTLDGSTVVRITNWDITSRGEITNRRHTYLPKDDARKVWEIVLKRGYTVANTTSGDAVEALVCIGAGLSTTVQGVGGYSQGLLESASRNIRERIAGIRKAGLP